MFTAYKELEGFYDCYRPGALLGSTCFSSGFLKKTLCIQSFLLVKHLYSISFVGGSPSSAIEEITSDSEMVMTINNDANSSRITLCMLGNFACFFVVCLFFQNIFFLKNSFSNTNRVSNSYDQIQSK